MDLLKSNKADFGPNSLRRFELQKVNVTLRFSELAAPNWEQ